MSGLPIDVLEKYGPYVFLVGSVCSFLWVMIRGNTRLLNQLTVQISNERERWEKMVDNHLTHLNQTQQQIATSLGQSAVTLNSLSMSHGNHDDKCSEQNLRIAELLSDSSRTLKSIESSHTIHNSAQIADHSQSATEHAVIMERLPKSRNGYKPRKKRK